MEKGRQNVRSLFNIHKRLIGGFLGLLSDGIAAHGIVHLAVGVDVKGVSLIHSVVVELGDHLLNTKGILKFDEDDTSGHKMIIMASWMEESDKYPVLSPVVGLRGIKISLLTIGPMSLSIFKK